MIKRLIIIGAIVTVLLSTPVVIALIISHISINTTAADVYFPVQKAGNLTHLELKSHGWLILEKGALRVRPLYFYCTSYLIVWPSGYTFEVEGREVRVMDRDGKVVARTGHWMTFGGGPSTGGVSQYYLENPIPTEYPGPFYIVSGVN